jgi:hypothetical protein
MKTQGQRKPLQTGTNGTSTVNFSYQCIVNSWPVFNGIMPINVVIFPIQTFILKLIFTLYASRLAFMFQKVRSAVLPKIRKFSIANKKNRKNEMKVKVR